MHMGYFAANNIYQRMMLQAQNTEEARKTMVLELDEISPMIGLAVGKKAVSYWPEGGVTSGEDVMKLFFGDDLGFTSESSLSLRVCKFGMNGSGVDLMWSSLLESFGAGEGEVNLDYEVVFVQYLSQKGS
jgi:hypothetical protein